jgi:hypothetical protein
MLNDDVARSIRRHQKRKVETICKETYEAFYKAIGMYGVLNAEEIMEIGLNLIEAMMIRPLQRMSKDPDLMRKSIVYQIAALVGDTPDEPRQ